MNVRSILAMWLVIVVISSQAQIAPDKYYIQFTDKNNSPYSIDRPLEFLSQRALDRRDNQGIAVVANDLPVNPQYLEGVADAGADILWPTKWLNGVTIYTESQSVLDAINDLPYVQGILALNGREQETAKDFFERESTGSEYKPAALHKGRSAGSLDYGWAELQIEQINGVPLHDDGYQGQGMVIAVLDGGFYGVEEHPVFDSLWANGQVLGTRDYVNPGGSVFTESQHGKSVLSTMAANSPGTMVGTAPKASYWLIKSEDVKSEHVIEEYNWLSAAEFADSLGADIINSSLSYVDFDYPQWDHDYADLDGETAISTRAADFAASKGILVCNSAGNSGNTSFPWNGAPADADSVFSVGALDYEGLRASFSSIGPTVDGRIKPAIMALGQGTTVAEGTSGVTWGSGTSYSSPIIAGMSACLWQANPDMSVMEIQDAIKQSGSYSEDPDNYMGWGIPDYALANSILTTVDTPLAEGVTIARMWPNPFSDVVYLEVLEPHTGQLRIEFLNTSGSVISSATITTTAGQKYTYRLPGLPAGVYFTRIISGNQVQVVRIVRH